MIPIPNKIIYINTFYSFFSGKNTVENDPNSICLPKRKIGFLKTHKCASSTIQNILLRFVIKNNLNVVLPAKSNYLGVYFKRDGPHFDRKMMENTSWEHAGLEYDIFLCHTRWNHTSVSQVLNDHGEVFYFSILRDPVELFRSYWDYYKLSKIFERTLEEYIITVVYTEVKFKNKTEGSQGYNQMLTDFGLDFNEFFKGGVDKRNVEDRQIIETKIKEIDKKFSLILLADEEYFEDSIILLKNALCWQYGDVVSVKLNSQSSKPRSKLSSRSRTIVKGSQFRYIFLNM